MPRSHDGENTDRTSDARPTSAYRPTVSHLAPGSFVESGDRSFFVARNLGIADATNGDYSLTVVRSKPRLVGTTGWHYHRCDVQIVYCVRGWEELAFEDGTTIRLVAGSCVNIPPGFGHNEVAYSDDLEVLVFTSPAQIDTIEIDEPPMS